MAHVINNNNNIFFIFSNISIVRNNFYKTVEFQVTLSRQTLEKEANRWKIAKKMIIFTIVCCHGNGLQ